MNAPEIDELIRHFEWGLPNPEQPSRALMDAMDPLFAAMADLAPYSKNAEAKILWITVPRGELADYGDFEEMKAYGEVKNKDEFRKMWLEEYPDERKWYHLVISENEPGSRFKFRGVSIDNTSIVSADLTDGIREETWFKEEPAIEFCDAILPVIVEAMNRLRAGTYNGYVNSALPFQHRVGVIRRSDEWQIYPEMREREWEGMDANTYLAFKSFMALNDEECIGRIKAFTANDFFRACAIGYNACGYDIDDTPANLYLQYADGRDEGLTGRGHGLNESPGIAFDDPVAWDAWYFDRHRSGGHPWEIIRGGNSTHVELYVRHDRDMLDWKHRAGELTEEEYAAQKEKAGYYFEVAGKHRPVESVRFFVSLRKEGFPVILHDADEIAARYEGTDYIGIVPHRTIPKYCEDIFPERYGKVIDFMHVYADEYDELKGKIEWLPEEPAKLKVVN